MIVLRTFSKAATRARNNENKIIGQIAESGNHNVLLNDIANETARGKRQLAALKDVTQRGGLNTANSIPGKQKMGELAGIGNIRKNSQVVPKYVGKNGAEIAARRKANLERIGTTAKLQAKRSERILNSLRGGVPIVPKSSGAKLAGRLLKR